MLTQQEIIQRLDPTIKCIHEDVYGTHIYRISNSTDFESYIKWPSEEKAWDAAIHNPILFQKMRETSDAQLVKELLYVDGYEWMLRTAA